MKSFYMYLCVKIDQCGTFNSSITDFAWASYIGLLISSKQ